MQEATQPRHVLVVLGQQNREQLLWRDQTAKPAFAVDHRKAGFITLHRLPRCVLLICFGCHHGGAGSMTSRKRRPVRRGEHPLNGGDTDQAVVVEHRHRRGTVEAFRPAFRQASPDTRSFAAAVGTRVVACDRAVPGRPTKSALTSLTMESDSTDRGGHPLANRFGQGHGNPCDAGRRNDDVSRCDSCMGVAHGVRMSSRLWWCSPSARWPQAASHGWPVGAPLADACWIAGTSVALVPAVLWVLAALRRGRAGVDLIAVLSLVGTLLVGEYLAGCIDRGDAGRRTRAGGGRRATSIARFAGAARTRAAIRARRIGSEVTVIPLAEVAVDDLLVVGPGEVVPVDGRIVDAVAVLDESVLTGEPLQVERGSGEPVRSGVVNAGNAFELRATATAQDSTYAGIVRLAEQAGAESAPIVRLADRYAAWFLPLALLMAGAAWLASGSAVRAVAVLVVATPCPLLLAAPVAIVSGLSRASRQGVVIRSGGALENLGHATTLVMDKTGTLTMGRPVVVEILTAPGRDATEVLRLAASVDQMSPHVLAEAIVTEALTRDLQLSLPSDVVEEPGRGVTATIDDRRVQVGKLPPDMIAAGWARAAVNRASLDSAAIAWVCIDGEPTGAVLLRDPLRRHAPRTVRRLRAAGLNRLVMLTGDRAEPAREVATVLGLDEVYAQQSPADKVAAVRARTRSRGDRDGRRRSQRRSGVGRGHRRCRDGRARRDGILGSR